MADEFTVANPEAFALMAKTLNGIKLPSSGVMVLLTWEQAQSLGMTKERWGVGEEVSPGLRMFSQESLPR